MESRTPSASDTRAGADTIAGDFQKLSVNRVILTILRILRSAGPQYKFKVDPRVSVARQGNQRRQGEVILEAIINEDGIPVDIVPRTFFGAGLEAAAMEALKQTRFYPAIYRGAPIPTRVAIRYKFTTQGHL